MKVEHKDTNVTLVNALSIIVPSTIFLGGVSLLLMFTTKDNMDGVTNILDTYKKSLTAVFPVHGVARTSLQIYLFVSLLLVIGYFINVLGTLALERLFIGRIVGYPMDHLFDFPWKKDRFCYEITYKFIRMPLLCALIHTVFGATLLAIARRAWILQLGKVMLWTALINVLVALLIVLPLRELARWRKKRREARQVPIAEDYKMAGFLQPIEAATRQNRWPIKLMIGALSLLYVFLLKGLFKYLLNHSAFPPELKDRFRQNFTKAFQLSPWDAQTSAYWLCFGYIAVRQPTIFNFLVKTREKGTLARNIGLAFLCLWVCYIFNHYNQNLIIDGRWIDWYCWSIFSFLVLALAMCTYYYYYYYSVISKNICRAIISGYNEEGGDDKDEDDAESRD